MDPFGISALLPSFSDKALHDRDLSEGFLGHGAGFRELVLDHRALAPQETTEHEAAEYDYRSDHEGREHEIRVQEGQQRQRSDQIQDLAQEFGHLMAHDTLESGAIRGQPAGQLTGTAQRIEPRGERKQVREQVLSKLCDQSFAGRSEQEDLNEIQNGLNGKHDYQKHRDPV